MYTGKVPEYLFLLTCKWLFNPVLPHTTPNPTLLSFRREKVNL